MMSENPKTSKNGTLSMSEGVSNHSRESQIVTGTCNHYFTVYRRLRHWDQKVGSFSYCRGSSLHYYRQGCSPQGLRWSTRVGWIVPGMGRLDMLLLSDYHCRGKCSQPQQSSKNKWVSAFRSVKGKPDSIRWGEIVGP